MSTSPVLVWLRRDLRLTDQPALTAAVRSGRPVIPVFICDQFVEGLGAAPKWRLGLGVAHFSKTLEQHGSRLVLRRGDALSCLQCLMRETGAGAVYWSRLYDPQAVARDTEIKSTLKAQGIDARSYAGHLMFEPWTVQTKTGGFYKVYTPFWKTVKERGVDSPLPAPGDIPAPQVWPESDAIDEWQMHAGMHRGASIVRPYVRLGEAAAHTRLATFVGRIVGQYGVTRDQPGVDGTSGLSENLAVGEISPQQCWHAGMRALHEGKTGAEVFLKELVWREFAYHLMHHTPHILTQNWKEDWNAFPWNTDENREEVVRWKQGRTGIEFVDAAMREMYVTGRMHNRGRMIVASYLTKHLLTDWKIGQRWFETCLTDWDPASNAMGWQWSAGSGPDATPYFRVFNPVTQLDKFDKDRTYTDRWIAEGHQTASKTALSYFDAIPAQWNFSPSEQYPAPVVPADVGRKIALEAYQNKGF
ncbi:MAG: deoxyribodipyrimidine photo-lyase [Roseobacter sp.]